MNIQQIHDDVYNLLASYHDRDVNFLYTFRRSDMASRLSKGYWFYGNDDYLAVSFWSGIDYKRNSPNISFVIGLDRMIFLDVHVSDSALKKEFAEKYLMPILPLEYDGKYLRKYYESSDFDYIKVLEYFIQNDKLTIDRILIERRSFFSRDPRQAIGFLSLDDFMEAQNRVLKYRLGALAFEQSRTEIYKLASFHIANDFPIKSLYLKDISFQTQWVFLTGDNGTGKTSILRSLVRSLDGSLKTEPSRQNTYSIIDFFDEQGKLRRMHVNPNDSGEPSFSPITLAAYGASRLKIMDENFNVEGIRDSMLLENVARSLFDDVPLLNLYSTLVEWEGKHSRRLDDIRLLLTAIIPNLFNIRFKEINGRLETIYIERDEFGNEMEEVDFYRLASGLRSLVGMLGDMLMRFWIRQPNKDPSEFKGIVIIDEIDIHLHPNNQKRLVEKLTEAFPKIQFIVTTHSPIPLLGAPEGSVFFKVSRTVADGVFADNLSSIDFRRLLPNAILSSELFQMGELFVRKNLNDEEIRTEDSVQEIQRNDSIKAELNQIADRLMQGEGDNG